ncbi:DUF2147 domain-containing protein [Paracoccus sp. Z118]|uniref:DUF2147 domain-containing protein n=1 Tax=Paracoccus sp. Z118 TaxID=2851017 RepID=UPI001C2B8FC3|nr:DUF2147 domain-containing protein [Paracoccus sp. Z118]MBV0892754.1 DUF2147 domain-containing protein [Paracoccus sp. Z118]
MRIFALAAAFALAASGAVAADPIEGIWQTQADEGSLALVSIEPCGGAFCGTIVKTYKDGAEYPSPNVGKQIVRSMAPIGDGSYEGQVWRPANDKVYQGKASLSGQSMKLSGCVAGGLICKSQTWIKLR